MSPMWKVLQAYLFEKFSIARTRQMPLRMRIDPYVSYLCLSGRTSANLTRLFQVLMFEKPSSKDAEDWAGHDSS